MQIKEVVDALERFAPLPLQDGFDNAGMQIGLTEVEATGALLCLDVTEDVIDEAVACGCNLIVSHHPLIFKALKRVTGRGYVERCVMKAIRHGVAIYSAHTNLDNAFGGVNYKIAEKLGLTNVRALEPSNGHLLKLVTFVPTDYADKVRAAMFAAGCGQIGNYDCCSFNQDGYGTFRAHEGCNPFCGSINELHRENEVKIETIVPAYCKDAAVRALLEAHPYEEPAYDIYALQNDWDRVGSGIVGELEEPITELDLLKTLRDKFAVECVKHNSLSGRAIKRVALCGGAGAFLLQNAIKGKADAFITGEIRYHDYFGHDDEILIAEIGHYESEQYTTEILSDVIGRSCPGLRLLKSNINTNPIKYFK
jgi:dinuclear metal center YbgI/SA1388 family protein